MRSSGVDGTGAAHGGILDDPAGIGGIEVNRIVIDRDADRITRFHRDGVGQRHGEGQPVEIGMHDAARAEFLDEIGRCHESAGRIRRHQPGGLGAHAEHDAFAFQARGAFARQRDLAALVVDEDALVVDRAFEQVHRRRADEARDETRDRTVIDLFRRADLLHPAAIHHHQPVGQRHRLGLVMRDEDRGGAEAAMQAADFSAHGDAQLGVEVRQRLVEEEHLRFADHRAAHGDALALAAGKGGRPAVEEGLEAQRLGDLGDPPAALGLRHTRHLQGVADILGDCHMRIEGVILEHHGAAALARLHLVDDASVNGDFTAGDFLEAGDHAQERGLAAAGWAEDDDEFAGLDLQVDAVNDGMLAVALLHITD
ncbi:hypothetical protein RHECNPAF_35000108 [Rhizobium etli CNPAF512]|nr:hypothetical protein RHECNPAF_35000108 [Rhizobium etli CNPAF512]